MRTCCIAKGTPLHALCASNEKEIQKRGNMCICVANSFCCTVEINITSLSKYIPIQINKNENFTVANP